MIVAVFLMSLGGIPGAVGIAGAEPWTRHTIDRSSRGADGVRLADVNGDGRMDLATGWEEGGVIRVYLSPGPRKAKQQWPQVTVGRVKSPEDAVFADLDGDGAVDVVSSCEGRTMCMFVHWAPKQAANYLDENAWTTEPIPVTKGMTRWMYALPMDMDGRNGVDLVVASKSPKGVVGWLRSPKNPRDLGAWTFHKLQDAGWIMSLESADMDGDGDRDIVVSDRKGGRRGVYWLQNPGAGADRENWLRREIGGDREEVMFLDVKTAGAAGGPRVVVPTRNGHVIVFEGSVNGTRWRRRALPNPFGVAHGKAVRLGDLDGDGIDEIVHTTNTGGNRSAPGVAYLKRDGRGAWTAHDISGKEGVKFDLIQLQDLDADGDLDLLSCEERDNLGVFWYENPTR